MKYKISAFLLALYIFGGGSQAQIVKKRVATLMGSRFDFTVVASSDSLANYYIDTTIKEISRIENIISEWRPNTEVYAINRNAGLYPVKVSWELFQLTQHALFFSKLTNGAFDISVAAMDKIWKFDGSMDSMPSPTIVKKSIENVSYKYILLDSADTTIFLKKVGMKIGFGSIGKGYAADRGRALLQSLHVENGIVNASGDMSVWGKQPNGKDWVIGITDPFHPTSITRVIPILDASIVTSGSYEKKVIFNGKRYSHIINPATGYPATGLISVTVKGASAEFANGLSTSIMVLGLTKGIQLMKKFPNYSFLLITDKRKKIESKDF